MPTLVIVDYLLPAEAIRDYDRAGTPVSQKKGRPTMAGKIDARLAELGIELPEAPAPAANYVPYTISAMFRETGEDL